MNKWFLVFLLVLGPVLSYLLGAFVTYEFNPAIWEDSGRFVVALFSVLIDGLILMAYFYR